MENETYKDQHKEALEQEFNKSKKEMFLTETEVGKFSSEEIDATKLKIEINELVWRFASENITLKQAEDIAYPFWEAIVRTHE